eukprot:10187055-Lingulodinium_polyedra.AAC.1
MQPHMLKAFLKLALERHARPSTPTTHACSYFFEVGPQRVYIWPRRTQMLAQPNPRKVDGNVAKLLQLCLTLLVAVLLEP